MIHIHKPLVPPGKSNAQMIGLPARPQTEQAIELIYCNNCGERTLQLIAFAQIAAPSCSDWVRFFSSLAASKQPGSLL